MASARQLYDLQGVDQQIKAAEDTLTAKTAQQRESDELIAARDRLADEDRRFDGLRSRQRELEREVSGLVAKIAASEEQLYGGRVRNPKELMGLQAEVDAIKAKRDEQENALLLVMDEAEQAQKDAESAAAQFKQVEAKWRTDQRQLAEDIEQVQSRLVELRKVLGAFSGEIDAESLDMYQRLKKAKGQAVAKVEQGICRGCRISASASELQRARSGKLVSCSSCGRIIYLP